MHTIFKEQLEKNHDPENWDREAHQNGLIIYKVFLKKSRLLWRII